MSKLGATIPPVFSVENSTLARGAAEPREHLAQVADRIAATLSELLHKFDGG